MTTAFPEVTADHVRAELLARREIALLDVREEDEFARSHPLWAANLSLNRLELDAWGRIPRHDTPVVVYGSADGVDAHRAGQRLRDLGYTRVALLAGGLAGWTAAGGELFIDVNVPSKAFGEWLEARRNTPSLPAQDVKALLDEGADIVVLDARRFDEYQAMSIPGAVSVPGAELVLRVRDLAPDPATRVIVNCAGRTRSLVGAQSLVNAGIPNPVAALRNGTIGWTLAGQALATGASCRPGAVSDAARVAARADARRVADRAHVARIDAPTLARWRDEPRTTYLFDVRTAEEYAAGHLAGFRAAPGGQLVQETDVHAPVRGARIVVADHDGTPAGSVDAGVRAEMTASWLAQMGWAVALLDAEAAAGLPRASGKDAPPRPVPPVHHGIAPRTLADWLAGGPDEVQVIDVTTSANYVKRHIPGAWFVQRSGLADALAKIPASRRIVLTCATSVLAWWVVDELHAVLTDAGREAAVSVLQGGTDAWLAAGLPGESGETRLASPRVDRYRRPYEGTGVPASAMQAYLDWEYGLVAQLERDATHGFEVL